MLPVLDAPTAIHAPFSSTQTLLQKTVDAILSSGEQSSLHPSDFLQIGYLWRVIEPLIDTGELYPLIRKRREEIWAQKEHWRARIAAWQNDPLIAAIEKCSILRPIEAGAGAAYSLQDMNAIPRFVVKPVDEDIFCLNNHKNCASPFHEDRYRVRPGIPLYRSAQTDAAASRMAELMGMPEITPRTIMAILSSSDFFDLSTRLAQDEQLEFLAMTGLPDQEKLCSVQEYFSHTKDLNQLTEGWRDQFTMEEIEQAFDQREFERMIIFIWALYDNDAHGSNILTYIKETQPNGKPVYGLKKIDNGLAFPEQNAHLVNLLAHFPNASRPLSTEAKSLIAAIPLEKMIGELNFWEMESSIEAFLERIHTLQTLTTRDGLTIAEINLRLLALAHPDGPNLALSELSFEELEEVLDKASTHSKPK